jgi:hypothetical protein
MSEPCSRVSRVVLHIQLAERTRVVTAGVFICTSPKRSDQIVCIVFASAAPSLL